MKGEYCTTCRSVLWREEEVEVGRRTVVSPGRTSWIMVTRRMLNIPVTDALKAFRFVEAEIARVDDGLHLALGRELVERR